jgi:hypothetical protein
VKDIIKLEFVIIGISTIITIYIYSSIGANSSQLALTIENLVPNFWICKNGTISTSLALLAGRWHVFFFPDVLMLNYTLTAPLIALSKVILQLVRYKA